MGAAGGEDRQRARGRTGTLAFSEQGLSHARSGCSFSEDFPNHRSFDYVWPQLGPNYAQDDNLLEEFPRYGAQVRIAVQHLVKCWILRGRGTVV
jgi:hypothetical protein